jgi:hypothetical protein
LRQFVWNNNHRVERLLFKTDGTSHTIGATNFAGQYYNSDSSNKVELLLGLAEDTVMVSGGGALNVTAGMYGYVGVGFDGTGLDLTYVVGNGYLGTTNALPKRFTAGYHYIALVEGSGSSGTSVTLAAGTVGARVRM